MPDTSTTTDGDLPVAEDPPEDQVQGMATDDDLSESGEEA